MNLLEKESWIREREVRYEAARAEEIIAEAAGAFPRIAFACSFGAEDVVLVDIIQRIRPRMDMFYLDTGFHFQETYETRNRLMDHYGCEFIQVLPAFSPEEQAVQFGEALWQSDPNGCCNIRKVEPLTRTLAQYDAWITGIRREQAPTRANARKVEYDTKFGLIKFNPIADWTQEEVWDYIREREIIYNPLHDRNYPSIGCTHCTRAVLPGEDPRAGRWAGNDKTECGLHK